MTTYIRENKDGIYTESVDDGKPELVVNDTDRTIKIPEFKN